MKKTEKKYIILIIVLIIFILVGIASSYVISNSSLSPKKYQNKLFIVKDGDMFFTEPYKMITANELEVEALKGNRIIYFDQNYVYSFSPTNVKPEDLTKSIESKVDYTVTGSQLNFILDEIAYSGYITKNGELELKIIGTTFENDPLIGKISTYEVNEEYEYLTLKEMYIENRNNAWNELKESLIKEIGSILGNEKYEQVVSNNRFGFQYNPDDITHPIIVLEKNQEYNNFVVKSVTKITDKMLSISLTTNEDSDSIFALLLDGHSSTITAEYSRVKVTTSNPVENALGIYSKALTVTFEMNSTGLQILEDNSTNNEETSNSSNDVESSLTSSDLINSNNSNSSSSSFNSEANSGDQSSSNNNNSSSNNNTNVENEDSSKIDNLQIQLEGYKQERKYYLETSNKKIESWDNDIKRWNLILSDLEKALEMNENGYSGENIVLPNITIRNKKAEIEFEIQNTKYKIGNGQSIKEGYEKEQKQELARYDKEIARLQEEINKLK